MVRDLVAYLPARVIGALAGLVAVAVTTRLFPPEEYARYVLFTLASTLYVSISVAWLGSSTVRFLSACDGDEKLRRLSGRIVALGVASTATTALLFAALAPVSRLVLAVIVLQAWWELLLSFLRGRRFALSYSAFSVWNSVAGLACGVVLATRGGYRVEGMIAGALVAVAAGLPWLWWIAVGKPSFAADGEAATTRELLDYGLPTLLINLFTWVMSNADRYLVEALAGARAMGIYAANYAIAERGIFFLNSMFLLASTPVGFGVWEKQGEEAGREYLSRLTRYYLLVAVPVTMGVCALARPLAGLMVDAPYRVGANVIPVVAVGALLVGVTHRYSIVLSFFKRTGTLMLTYAVCGVANVAMNVFAVPRWGHLAAAWVTLVTYALNLGLVFVLSRRMLAWPFPVASAARICLAALVMAAAVSGVVAAVDAAPIASLVLGVPVGLLAYAVAIVAVGEVTHGELGRLPEAFARRPPRAGG